MKLWDDIRRMFGQKPEPPPEDPAAANEREKRLDDMNAQIEKSDSDRLTDDGAPV
jgi:hypothetical protein